MMGIQLMEIDCQNDIEKFVSIRTYSSNTKYTPVPFKKEDLWNGYPKETNTTYEN